MITKFRVEGESDSKADLLDELAMKGNQIIRLVDPGTARGNWRITDDVNSFDRDRGIHVGRVVYSRQ